MPYMLMLGLVIGVATGLGVAALFITLAYRMAQIHAAEED